MNTLQVFNNPSFGSIRAVAIDGEPWFVGKDVAEALGYKDAYGALKKHVDAEDKQTCQNDSFETPRGMTIVNESGVYALIFGSNLPKAKAFKHWVTSDVLPSIRKNGGYIGGQETMTPEELMASALIVAQRTIQEKEARISALSVRNAILQPKADYFDELVERNTLTNFRETAKELGVKERKFIQFLMDKKFVFRDKKGKLTPYADKNDGLFEVKECFNEKTQWSGIQTLVTPKGRETFRLLLVV